MRSPQRIRLALVLVGSVDEYLIISRTNPLSFSPWKVSSKHQDATNNGLPSLLLSQSPSEDKVYALGTYVIILDNLGKNLQSGQRE